MENFIFCAVFLQNIDWKFSTQFINLQLVGYEC